MKITCYQHSMLHDLTEHWQKTLNLNDDQVSQIYRDLNDNILMNIKLNGKWYEVPYKYWWDFTDAYFSACGSCNEQTLFEIERTKNMLLLNSTELKEGSNDFWTT